MLAYSQRAKLSRRSGNADAAEQQSSPLDLPLLPRHIFDEEIKTHLNKLSDEQWNSVKNGDFEQGVVVILSQMIETVFDKFVQTLAQEHRCIDSKGHHDSGSTRENNGKPLQDKCSNCRAAQASLEEIFHSCFGKALGIVQPNCFNTDNLIKLFIGVIKRREQMSETPTTWSSFQESLHSNSPTADSLIIMTYNVIYLLRKCLQTQDKLKKYQESEEESNKSDDNTESTAEARREKSETETPTSESSETESPISESSETAPSKLESSETESPISESSETLTSKSESSPEAFSLKALLLEQLCRKPDQQKIQERNFVAEFLMELIKCISFQAGKNPRNVDFFRILLKLTKLTEGKLYPRLANPVDNIVRKVYNELFCKYGSKNAIYVVIESRHSRFEETLANILIEKVNELEWWEKVKIYFKNLKAWFASSLIMRILRSIASTVRNLFCFTVEIKVRQ